MIITPEQLTGKTNSHLTSILIGEKQFSVHHAVKNDLLLLVNAANKSGFNFHIASGFRSFEQQLIIWNEKYSGKRTVQDDNNQALDISILSSEEKTNAILRWSALPGASRHHWGTDFDVYNKASLPLNEGLKLEPWEYFDSHQKIFCQWLLNNIQHYGFYFPYKEDSGGVAIEPWHISHKLSSISCLNSLTIELLSSQLRDEPLLGKETVLSKLKNIYTQYIINISS